MNLSHILIGFIGCVITLSVYSGLMQWNAGQQQFAMPKVVVAHTKHDFGKLNQTDRELHLFEVNNNGDRRLVIVESFDDCSCHRQRGPSIVIAPGSSQNIPVRLDASRYFGAVSEWIEFTTNDPNHPKLRFELTAMVEGSPLSESKADNTLPMPVPARQHIPAESPRLRSVLE